MTPVIIHLDMNSYFASVEQQDNKEYRGKLLGVCEHLGGIIIAASIEAKRWGIKTGTPVWEAKKLYPKIILVHTRADAYREYHRRFLKVMRDYSNFVEPASIDEAYADVSTICNIRCHSERAVLSKDLREPRNPLSGDNQQLRDPSTHNYFLKQKENNYSVGMTGDLANPWEEAVKVAQEIKARMKKEVGDYLTCSIGIAENKLLAKIASDMKKPDGIVVILPCHSERAGLTEMLSESRNPLSSDNSQELRDPSARADFESKKSALGRDDSKEALIFTKDDLYTRLKLTDIPGIAKRQEKRLNDLGIKTLKELRDYPVSKLVRVFGINGYHLHHMGQLSGSWKARVNFDESIKSIGHMYTLPKEYRKPEFFEPVLYKLCEMVGERLRRKKLMGNIVVAYVRDGNYNSYGHSVKLSNDIFDARDLFWESRHIIKNYPDINKIIANCKLIGVTVAGLKPFVLQQSLFKKQTAQSSLTRAVDVINAKYGKFTLSYAPVLKAGKVFRDSVGFGRVKEVGGDADISIRPGKSFVR